LIGAVVIESSRSRAGREFPVFGKLGQKILENVQTMRRSEKSAAEYPKALSG
jgi:hypothetical protein